MLNVTLDNNCIIDLEQNNAMALYIKKLIQMHRDRKINLRVVAISASERKPDHTYVSHFDEFKVRITKIGLGDLEILETIAYVGLAFVDYCLLSGGALDKLEREVQGIMFPKIELSYGDFCKIRNLDPNNKKAWQRWANVKCDVLALWSHIWYKGNIFVTTDEDFHKKTVKPRLVTLGAGKILRPDEAVKLLANEEGLRKDNSAQTSILRKTEKVCGGHLQMSWGSNPTPCTCTLAYAYDLSFLRKQY